MQVQFTSESIDYDGDSLTYSWQFDEATTQSTEANPVFSFEKAGTYDVLLTIEDPSGETATFKQEIMVGNELADLSFDFNGNQTFYWDNSTVAYNIKVNDKEDGELGNGIDPSRVVVSIDYLERGADKNMIEMGHQAMVDASANLIGKQLMKNSDCSTCHQLNVASVGPTYEQIAEKYGEQTDAVEYLSNKIIKGGGGVWGEIAMAAHPQLSQGEARKMVQYILSLGENSTAPSSLPLKDTYVMKEHLGKGEEGSYIFSASYTDKGGDKIGPLTARKSYVLRHPKMQAESYSAFEDAMQFEVKPGMAPGVEEAFTIMIGTGVGSWIRYDQIDMTGVASIEIMASAIAQFTSGGFVEFRLDAPDGDLIGNLKVENSLIPSSDPKWLNLQATEGIHDLYLVFNAEGEVSKPICIVDWLTFHNQGATQ
ncbi:MAG: carbohydrate-binding protein [Bacteroidota bacterium]